MRLYAYKTNYSLQTVFQCPTLRLTVVHILQSVGQVGVHGVRAQRDAQKVNKVELDDVKIRQVEQDVKEKTLKERNAIFKPVLMMAEFVSFKLFLNAAD